MSEIVQPPVKARSVTVDGELNGFQPSPTYRPQVLQGGVTRLEISSPLDKLHIVHQALVGVIEFPCKARYLQMTDREKGQLPKPVSYASVDISRDKLFTALVDYHELFYQDARHQLWILGANNEQIVLDELGMIYVYPDDFLFTDILLKLGWSTQRHLAMSEQDYVQVYFLAIADKQEESFLQTFGLIRWDG